MWNSDPKVVVSTLYILKYEDAFTTKVQRARIPSMALVQILENEISGCIALCIQNKIHTHYKYRFIITMLLPIRIRELFAWCIKDPACRMGFVPLIAHSSHCRLHSHCRLMLHPCLCSPEDISNKWFLCLT